MVLACSYFLDLQRDFLQALSLVVSVRTEIARMVQMCLGVEPPLTLLRKDLAAELPQERFQMVKWKW